MMEEARLLLDEADRLWSPESDTAAHVYKRLLAEYADFLYSLGARIRIKRRAEQAD